MTLAADYPASVVCKALGLPRSTFYARSQAAPEEALRDALREQAGRWPTYGYRRLTALLRRGGHEVNEKRSGCGG